MNSKKVKFIKKFLNIKSIRMLFLGFSSGLPILLVFSTLSVWLVKAGVTRATVTMFSWAGLAYSFKFIWSPLVDNFKLPFGQFGHRKSWLLLSQILIVISLIFISNTDPSIYLIATAIGAIMIAVSSATQDIVIDAYRIESASQKMQGALSSMYIAGYRIAMLIAGAGSLYLASFFGAEDYNVEVWKKVYLIMAGLMLVGILTTIFSPEPKIKRQISLLTSNDQLRFLVSFVLALIIFIFTYSQLIPPIVLEGPIHKFLFTFLKICLSLFFSTLTILLLIKINIIPKNSAANAYLRPILEFTNRYGNTAFLILMLIGLYRIADIVMGVVANIFYLEKGYDIKEIATYSKFFGVFATIFGGLVGGYSSIKYGTIKALFFGALIAAASNLLFAWLAISNASINSLIIVITADNISSGFAGAAFVVYLSALTSIKFTATQYALFSSLMILITKVLAGYSGSIVDIMGYSNFYIFTAILGIPVLILIFIISKIIHIK